MPRRCGAFLAVIALACVALRAGAADDASRGYEAIKPALVKVWAFDRNGRPSQSGTGVIVDAGDRQALILTATHVIDGAAGIRIDVSRDIHDLSARIERRGPRDLTLLTVTRGGLHAAHFAPRSRLVVEGNLVAVAGYVKMDELIGVVGQEPRLLYPGTISSRPDDGRYLELENVHIEEGLSGGAVFDPASGEVLGIVTSRTADRRGGFADSGAAVVVPFLAANRLPPPAPHNMPSATPPNMPPATPPNMPPATPPNMPSLSARLASWPSPPRRVSLPAAVPAPLPAATLQAQLTFVAPAPAIVAWQSTGAEPKRFIVVRSGCRVAVTIDVQTLQFVVAHRALVSPHHRGELLDIALQERPGTMAACDAVAEIEPTDAAYEPTAMSFNDKHVTMRFAYAGTAENGPLFPPDASLDADLVGGTATVQFFASDWSGAITLPLSATPLAAVSSTW